MYIWFFISMLGAIAIIPLYFLSVEHLKLQKRYGKEKGTEIGKIYGLISGWGFFFFWMGIWVSPQPRFTIPVLQNLSVFVPFVNFFIPLLHLLISVPFLIAGPWLAIKGVKETTLKVAETHRTETIITTGSYSIVRHPQYLGGLLAHAGISFLLSAWYSLLVTPLMVALVYLISRKEEEELIREFGEKYEDYKKRVPMLLPTRKWWFILFFILLQFIPAYGSKGYEPSKMGEIIGYILEHSVVSSIDFLYPVFKVIPLLIVLSIVLLDNRATRWFNAYAGISYVLFAFLQSIAVTEEYGLSIVTNNFIMFLIVAAFWFWEASAQRNDFTPQKQPGWKYWVIPFAFLAFWYPANPLTLMPDFNPVYFLTNGSGLAFCMMTPVYLAILTLYYPRINIATLRVTSIAGTIIGFYNILVNFFMVPSVLWWNGLLHIPLITISVYGLMLSFKKRKREN